jgi:hypothetical protein
MSSSAAGSGSLATTTAVFAAGLEGTGFFSLLLPLFAACFPVAFFACLPWFGARDELLLLPLLPVPVAPLGGDMLQTIRLV